MIEITADNWVYQIQLDDGSVIYVSGDDGNAAWGKVGFEGSMLDSWSPSEWTEHLSSLLPVVL